MAKPSQIERAIEALQRDIENQQQHIGVLKMAQERLREQVKPRKPKAVRTKPEAVAAKVGAA